MILATYTNAAYPQVPCPPSDVATFRGSLKPVAMGLSADTVRFAIDNVRFWARNNIDWWYSILNPNVSTDTSVTVDGVRVDCNSIILDFSVYVKFEWVGGTVATNDSDTYMTDRIYRRLLENAQSSWTYDLLALRRTDACVSVDDTTNLTFLMRPVGCSSNSSQICISNGLPRARGNCVGDFETGARWQVTMLTCPEIILPEPLSPVTVELQQLSQIPVTHHNVDSVTFSTTLLTNDSGVLTSTDITHVSVILTNIAALPVIDSYIADNFLQIVDNLANVNNETLYKSQLHTQSTARITSAVDMFTNNVNLNIDQTNLTVIRPSVSIHVFDVADNLSTVYGVGTGQLSWTNSSQFQTYSALPQIDDFTKWKSTIILPQEVIDIGHGLLETLKMSDLSASSSYSKPATYRTSFVIYESSDFFSNPQLGQQGRVMVNSVANSLIISGSINGRKITDLIEPVTIVFRLKQLISSGSQNCSYWKYDMDSDMWNWATDGLWTDSSYVNDSTIVCYSHHLTNFAVIAGFDQPQDTLIAKVLEYISIIGLSISIAGLVLTIASQILIRYTRKTRSQMVLVHLSISLLAVDILVLAGIDKVEPVTGCKAVAALLLYFLLVAFAWMLVEAVLQYFNFVKVFDTYVSHFMLKAALPAWICPGIIVIIVVIVDGADHVNLLRGPSHYCWLAADAFHFAFLLPLGLVMVINIVMFILVVKGMTCDRPAGLTSTQTQSQLRKLQLQVAICCFIVMGLTWLFAFFAIDRVATAFQILFCIFNSLQGVFIFVFLNVREKAIRDAWLKLFRRCCSCYSWQLEETQSSSGHVNGSKVPGAGKRRLKKVDVEMKHDGVFGTETTVPSQSKLTEESSTSGGGDAVKPDPKTIESACTALPAEVYVVKYNSVYRDSSYSEA
jgi:hypothetical protein